MYFEILRSTSGQYFFRIRAANHETLAHSETYVAKLSCQAAIAVIKGGAGGAPVYDRS